MLDVMAVSMLSMSLRSLHLRKTEGKRTDRQLSRLRGELVPERDIQANNFIPGEGTGETD